MIDPPAETAGRRALRESAASVGVRLDDEQAAVMTRSVVLTLLVPREAGTRPTAVASGIALDEVELRLLRLLAYDLGDAEIASRKGWARTSLRDRMRGLFLKLGVASRTQAVAVGYESGLLGGVRSGPFAVPARRSAGLSREPWATEPGGASRGAEAPLAALGLTTGHAQVLRLLAEGLDNTQVRIRLGLTKDQVKHRIRRLYLASGAESRTALSAWGRRVGLVGGDR